MLIKKQYLRSRTNNTQIDDAQYIDGIMPIYNLIEYGDNHSKTSRILSQFCRDVDDDDGEVTNFTDANATADFLNLKVKFTGQTCYSDF